MFFIKDCLSKIKMQEPKTKIRNIQKLSEHDSNNTISLQRVQQLYPQHQVTQSGYYYPYNQKYNDFGWGCAWRAIQTILSIFDITIDFKQLVYKYGRKQQLMKILIKNKQKYIEQIKQHKWAPEQNTQNWAQPFISKLICNDNNLSTELILVNGYPQSYAPENVYEQVLSFPQFWHFIKKHIPRSAVMIDDGQYALLIVGYKEIGVNQQKSILLADPHISSNKIKEQSTIIGIYEVILDKNGKQISNDVDQSYTQYYPFNSYKKIHFDGKKWMAMSAFNNHS